MKSHKIPRNKSNKRYVRSANGNQKTLLRKNLSMPMQEYNMFHDQSLNIAVNM